MGPSVCPRRERIFSEREQDGSRVVEKSKIFVAVAGNIGSGKSSLTPLLSSHYGWAALYESVEDNPYLADFYLEINRWSFNLHVYFLSKQFKDPQKIVQVSDDG